MNESSVYRHSQFQAAQLFSLYDLDRDRPLAPICHGVSEIGTVCSEDQSFYYRDPFDLFDFFGFDEDVRFNMLSTPSLNRCQTEFLKLMPESQSRQNKTWKLAVKRELLRTCVQMPYKIDAKFEVDPKVLHWSIVEKGQPSHVIVGIDCALFDVAIFDHCCSSLPDEDAKQQLNEAYNLFKKRLLVNEPRSSGSCCPSPYRLRRALSHRELANIEVSYFNNTRQTYYDRLTLANLVDYANDFSNRRLSQDFYTVFRNTTVRFKLLELNRFLADYTSHQENVPVFGQFFGLPRGHFSRLVFGLHSKRVEVERLAGSVNTSGCFKVAYPSLCGQLNFKIANAQKNIENCMNEARKLVSDYRRSGDGNLINQLVENYNRTLQDLSGNIWLIDQLVTKVNTESVAWAKRVEFFQRNGLQLLHSRLQLTSSTSRFVLVFDPRFEVDKSIEWKDFYELICQDRMRTFFYCPLEHFEREIGRTPEHDSTTFICHLDATDRIVKEPSLRSSSSNERIDKTSGSSSKSQDRSEVEMREVGATNEDQPTFSSPSPPTV